MTSYAEMERQGKEARRLYLEIRALGLEVSAEEDDRDVFGYRLELRVLPSLSPVHADRLTHRFEEAKPDMVRLLRVPVVPAELVDEDMAAVWKEGSEA